MKLIPKNWKQYQHYKDRSPPWIKLHARILNDKDFMMLPLASKALAPMLWLLASEHKTGEFEASVDELQFRTRLTKSEINSGLKPLIEKEFFIVASNTLAEGLQGARAERERETETEEKKNKAKNGFDFSSWPNLPKDEIMKGWLSMRKKKKAEVTQIVIESFGKKLTTAVKSGYTVDECLIEAIERSWTGFNSSWMPEKKQSEAIQQERRL